ncbi:hypothetical protein TOPH_03338 [Tolypocladium ophioglossoides CBS 100239]|uniref:Uncharacterized protein n=1 Tax=Tolypocladium ophioglossoides (strain CBS 100239) TaxID=1163406 RepID=A0A0L0NCQ6_TOLOC|nr:hypothetical protein TOPH_03338 [Tolypocladium ophioglossoides CBS 100239]
MSSLLDPYAKGGRSRRPEKQHRPSKTKSSPISSSQQLSFLFVVNELSFYTNEVNDFNRDQWYNTLPPRSCYGYSNETASRVMRYQGGEVTEAQGYHWFRSALCESGHCYSPSQEPLTPYSDFGIFSCGPHLPIVVMPGDPMTIIEGKAAMHALRFFHPPLNSELRGVSQATWAEGHMPAGGFPVKYVAGRDPSWIPGLVPKIFRNPETSVSSRGLGGELPIVLGLMAFSEAGDRVDEIFLGRNGHRGRWRDRVWMNHHEPQGCMPRPCAHAVYLSPTDMNAIEGFPRGFYIAVFNDPQNPEGSTDDRIHSFEWENVIVKEHLSNSAPRR